MKKKYYIILGIVFTILIVGVCAITSYAFFTGSVNGNSSANVITTGNMSLLLNDSQELSAYDLLPGSRITKPFSVKNNGDVDSVYDVYLSELINTFGDKHDLVYTVISTNGGCQTTSSTQVFDKSSAEAKIVSSCPIGAGQTHDYQLVIDYVEDGTNQDDNKGKKFAALISVNDYYDNKLEIATLEEGTIFNQDIKRLSGDINVDSDSVNTSINRIEISPSAPSEEDNYIYVDGGISTVDVKAWFKNGTIYLYSNKDKIYLSWDCSNMFEGLEGLTQLDLSHFDTSIVENMTDMFKSTKLITSLDLTNFDTSNVINMAGMFAGCKSLEHIYFGELFDTSNVTNMQSMFQNSNIAELDLSSFNTSNVTTMAWMFCGTNTETLDLSSFNTSNVTNMSAMITNMNISNINLGNNFDTSKVTDMSQMFRNIVGVTRIDLGNKFSVENADNVERMFMQDHYLNTLTTILSDRDLIFKSGVQNNNVFYKATNLVGGRGTTYNSNENPTNGYKYAVIDCGTKRPGYLTFNGTEEEYEQFCSQFD